MNNANKIEFNDVHDGDFEELFQIRISSMKDSLSAIGRFDPQRARERLEESFRANETKFILYNDEKAGFFACTENSDRIFIKHLYIIPGMQSLGIAKHVLNSIKGYAKVKNVKITLLALKKSKANDFYKNNGFEWIYSQEWDNEYQWDPKGANTNA